MDASNTGRRADEDAASKTEHQPGEAPTANVMPAGSTRVTVTLSPADGGTKVTLRHDDLPNTEVVSGLVICASDHDQRQRS